MDFSVFFAAEAAVQGVHALQWAAIAAARRDPAYSADDARQDVILAVLEGRANPNQNIAGWAFRAAQREGWRRQRIFSSVDVDDVDRVDDSPPPPRSRTQELDSSREQVLDEIHLCGEEAFAEKLGICKKTLRARLARLAERDLFSAVEVSHG